MNFELYQDYKHADILKVIKYDRLKWVGHVARMSEEQAAKTTFSGEPERGHRLRGRPRAGLPGPSTKKSGKTIWKNQAGHFTEA